MAEDSPKPGPAPLAGVHLLDILLDVIENPQAPKEQKATAKAMIREWVKEYR